MHVQASRHIKDIDIGDFEYVQPSEIDDNDEEQYKDLPIRIPSPSVSIRKKSRVTALEISDSGWTALALKYLLYARKLAYDTNQPISSVRQLPSITHMIAIETEDAVDDFPWRWCDAYHAIKYLKDNGLVVTSRGAKGTSIKDESHTIEHLIDVVRTRCDANGDIDQQGRVKYPIQKDMILVKLNVQFANRERNVSFSMRSEDLRALETLTVRALDYLRDISLLTGAPSEIKLIGYAEKGTGDFIHANTFTSAQELEHDAREIQLYVRL